MIRRLRIWAQARRVYGDHGEGLHATNRRILVNLSVFALLFLVLMYWAFTNVVQLNAVERPYPVTAEFTTSPGLHPGYAVTYLGVQVGRIGSVSLSGSHVDAVLEIDRGTSLPAAVTAAVRRMSAVGEPYVDLRPEPGTKATGPQLRAGDVIGLPRTTTPIEYSAVFSSISRLFEAVPTGPLRSLLDTVATGLQGRAPDIRTVITNLDTVSNTLASNAPLLDRLAGDLTQATGTVVAHESSLDASWSSLSALATTLASDNQTLGQLLTDAPTLGQQVSSLLGSSGQEIGCLFDAGAALWGALDNPATISALSQSVALAGPIATLLGTTTYEGPDGFYLNGLLVYNPSETATTMYNPPLSLPAPPKVPPCAAKAENGSTGTGAGTSATPNTPGGPSGLLAVPPPPRQPSSPNSSRTVHGGGIDWIHLARQLLPYLALAVLVAVAAATRPWRYLRRRGGT